MRFLCNCLITGCKYFTDKLIYLINFLIIIPLTLCIILKSKNVIGLRDVSWPGLILPIVFTVVFDMLYCFLCKYIYCEDKEYNNNLGYSNQV